MSSIQSQTGPHPIPRRGRDMLLLGGLFPLMLVGLISLAATTGWHETKAQFAKLTPSYIVILLTLSLVNDLLRGMRWHVVARRLGLPATAKLQMTPC